MSGDNDLVAPLVAAREISLTAKQDVARDMATRYPLTVDTQARGL